MGRREAPPGDTPRAGGQAQPCPEIMDLAMSTSLRNRRGTPGCHRRAYRSKLNGLAMVTASCCETSTWASWLFNHDVLGFVRANPSSRCPVGWSRPTQVQHLCRAARLTGRLFGCRRLSDERRSISEDGVRPCLQRSMVAIQHSLNGQYIVGLTGQFLRQRRARRRRRTPISGHYSGGPQWTSKTSFRQTRNPSLS